MTRGTNGIFLLILVATFLAASGCARTKPIYNVEDHQISVAATGEEGLEVIKEAIMTGGRQKGWKMTEVEPGHIVGELVVRQHFASVDIFYDSDSYSIKYKDSRVLMYDGTKIHRNYNKWVTMLDQQIALNLP